jgi:hypothetical protein
MVLLCVQSPTQNPYITAAVQVARPLLPADALPTLKPDDPGMFSLADPDRVRRILTETGFHDIALDPLSLPMQLVGPGNAADAADFSIQLGPLTWALESIDAGQRAAVIAAIAAHYRDLATTEGIVLQGAFWVITA